VREDAAKSQLKAVVVTRAEAANGPLSAELRSLGLSVLLWPAVNVAPGDMGPLEAALQSIVDIDWIVFASRYAVAAVIERIPTPPENLRVAAVGQATAQVLRQRGWPVHLSPSEANAAALVSAFSRLLSGAGGGIAEPLAGLKILFPASSRALPTISAGLTQLGARVLQVEAYRTEAASLDVAECRSWISRDAIGAVTFASPSAVIELERALGKEDFDRLLGAAKAVAIGPTTARELAERGREPVLAESATLRGLATTTFRLLQTRH
jgi:uroporphyrinogen-III synthase